MKKIFSTVLALVFVFSLFPIDSVSLIEKSSGISIAAENFEEPPIKQGLIPFQITDTKILPLEEQGLEYIMRSANVRDIDEDGSAEAVLTVTTYPDQLPQPVIVLGAKSGVVDLTQRLFPQGVPTVKHSPYILFPDLDLDGKTDIIFAEAGLDHEPYTGSRMVITLQNENGSFTDISPQIPEGLWGTRSYATAAGDLDGDGRPEVLFPDQGNGTRAMALTWKNGAFTANPNWIPRELWSGWLNNQISLEIADLNEDGWNDLIVGGGWGNPNLRLVFGGPQGFTAQNILTLPDGVFGHVLWEEWEREDVRTAQGTEVIGLVAADFDNDGRKDIFTIQEQTLQFKPGAITDTLEPEYRRIYDEGGTIYADTAFRVLKNQGNRKFLDITPANTPNLGRRYYLSVIPIDLNRDGFLDIVGGYWSKYYGNKPGSPFGSTVFLNDGTGAFQVLEGSELFPTRENRGLSEPEQLGIFLPTLLTSDRLEGLFVASQSDYHTGNLIIRKGIFEGAIGKGPGFSVVPKNAKAFPTDSSVLVNGAPVAFQAYNIGGNNYFKLRDIAKVLGGSEKQFEVGWDAANNAIGLTTGQVYTSVGGELAASGSKANANATLTTSRVYLDGKEIFLTAYTIGGNNYFKLRDLASQIDFGVTWDAATNTIGVDTTIGYAP